MEKNTLQELKEILFTNRGNLFDFICNNYYLLSKEELKDLCKEAFSLLYVYNERLNGEDTLEKVHQEYKENLIEWTNILNED